MENNNTVQTRNNKGIARGWWQATAWADMHTESGCVNPVASLQGAAKNYAGRYQASFYNMLNRAKKAGYTIERTPGPRGGEWSAVYRAR